MLNFPDWVVALAPAILLLGVGLTVAPMFRRTLVPARIAMALVAMFFSLRYLTWRATETLAPPGWTLDALVSWSFFFFEAGSIVSGISAFIILARHRNRSPDADLTCAEMVAADLESARRHALLKAHGYEVPVALED